MVKPTVYMETAIGYGASKPSGDWLGVTRLREVLRLAMGRVAGDTQACRQRRMCA
jgi:hypothetical protein